MIDVVERAQAVLLSLKDAVEKDDSPVNLQVALRIRDLIGIIPDLVEEVEKLRGVLIDGAVEQYKREQKP